VSDPVLLTAGTGIVGRALLTRLLAEGREVRALARSDRAADTLRALGAEPIRGDVLDAGSIEIAARGCASVFHVAGVNAMCQRDPRPMLRTNVDGSATTIRAAAAAGVGRVVFTSSASAIGERRGTVGSEDSPHRGAYLSNYERSKHLAERRVLRTAAEVGIDVVVVNPSSVQGPGRATGSTRLLLDVANGRLPFLVDTTISLVDIGDCSEGHLLAEARGVPGERYLLSGATLTIREAVEILRRVWGLPDRVRFAPGWVASAGAAVLDAGARLLGREAPICPESVRTLRHGHRYDGSRATRELGLVYTPIEDTVRRTLQWCADGGLVPPPRI
jgi:dihydroflavonol-4-reductase